MVPHFFLTGFKRFTLTLSFKYLLCPICHHSLRSKTSSFLSYGCLSILGCKATNKYTGKDCQTTKQEWKAKDTYKSTKENAGQLGSTA